MAELHRRGGRKSSENIVDPQNINGRVQELRDGNVRRDTGGCAITSSKVEDNQYYNPDAAKTKMWAVKEATDVGQEDIRRVGRDRRSVSSTGNTVYERQSNRKEEEIDIPESAETEQNCEGAIGKYAFMYTTANGIPAVPVCRGTHNPAALTHPLDLEMFDTAYMEKPIGEIKDSPYDWVHFQETPARCSFGEEGELSGRKQEIDGRREKEPMIQDPTVAYYIRNSAVQIGWELSWDEEYGQATDQRYNEGSTRGRGSISHYISTRKHTERRHQLYSGKTANTEEYIPQQLTIGELDVDVIDFGETIPIAEH